MTVRCIQLSTYSDGRFFIFGDFLEEAGQPAFMDGLIDFPAHFSSFDYVDDPFGPSALQIFSSTGYGQAALDSYLFGML